MNENENENENDNVGGGGAAAPMQVGREQDQYMPIANVIRIMRRIMPPHAKISDDAKETVQECVSEYISFVTGEANERCKLEKRKTITAEDILWAIEKLGFDNYIEPLTVFLNRYRECEGDWTLSRGAGELRRTYVMNYAPVPLGIGTQPPPPPHCVYRPPAGMFPAVNLSGVYYRMDESGDGSSSSSSQSQRNHDMANFDPYDQFK
ncbi:Nuclear transcription factor Y subunit B [Quillaja saponaria]|uniref:Nuclear transcription factor Y subunit B n=1 Tax=Quillaja saponaria TaxID=32244 RepID=A0AAD7PQP9_QUISA|nr:Nuclear transcription factor Y subunit B [Quillaja saponaria]